MRAHRAGVHTGEGAEQIARPHFGLVGEVRDERLPGHALVPLEPARVCEANESQERTHLRDVAQRDAARPPHLATKVEELPYAACGDEGIAEVDEGLVTGAAVHDHVRRHQMLRDGPFAVGRGDLAADPEEVVVPTGHGMPGRLIVLAVGLGCARAMPPGSALRS